jgi:hypothetical protein
MALVQYNSHLDKGCDRDIEKKCDRIQGKGKAELSFLIIIPHFYAVKTALEQLLQIQ